MFLLNQVAIHIKAVLLQVVSNVLHQRWRIIQHITLCPLSMKYKKHTESTHYGDTYFCNNSNLEHINMNNLCVCCSIGLYLDVWIAAIASSRTRLATLTGAMCKTSQCELRSLRVNSGMLNVIRIVTYYTLPPLESPASSWIAMAYSR